METVRVTTHLFNHSKFALPPNRLPSYSYPLSQSQIRQELAQIPFILDLAHEPAQGMPLPSPRRQPVRLRPLQLALHHPDCRRPLPHGAEIDLERAGAIKRPQRADAVAQTPEQNAELRTLRHLVLALEFRRRHEPHSHPVSPRRALRSCPIRWAQPIRPFGTARRQRLGATVAPLQVQLIHGGHLRARPFRAPVPPARVGRRPAQSTRAPGPARRRCVRRSGKPRLAEQCFHPGARPGTRKAAASLLDRSDPRRGRLAVRTRGIWASAVHITALCLPATRHAHELAKDAAESTPHDVARFVRREIQLACSSKLKAKPIEFERQRGQHSIVLAAERDSFCSVGPLGRSVDPSRLTRTWIREPLRAPSVTRPIDLSLFQEMFMEFREDPLASVIEEIAALLATGYLRLCKARTLSESATPPALQATGERLDSAPWRPLS